MKIRALLPSEDKELEPSEPVSVQKRRFWAEPAEDGKSVLLRWEQFPPDEGYVIYYSTDGQNYERIAELGCVQTAFRHKDPLSGNRHYYRIAAKKRQGEEQTASELIEFAIR